jgi:hypothetical protein
LAPGDQFGDEHEIEPHLAEPKYPFNMQRHVRTIVVVISTVAAASLIGGTA